MNAVTPIRPAQQPTLDARVVESVLISGDLADLTTEQRVSYYNRVCETLGLNPLTQPFAYIKLNNKLRLYALKDATEQLRKIHGVSITELTSQHVGDVFVVTAKAMDRDGRTDAATGAVAVGNLKGESLANALMKAETKAKRRATLSICGLGLLDETEMDTVQAQPTYVVEAPKQIEPVQLPEGTVQILKVEPKRSGKAAWCVVTYVDAKGEQHEAKTASDPKDGAAALCEQLAQEGCPVELTTRVNRNGATVIEEVARWQPQAAETVVPEQPPEDLPF